MFSNKCSEMWHTMKSVIPACGAWRKEYQEFKASLGQIARFYRKQLEAFGSLSCRYALTSTDANK